MKLLLSKMRSRRYTGFAVFLTAVMFAAVLCIAPAAADTHDESGSDEIWIPDAEDSDTPDQIDDGKVNGDEAVPQSSTSMVYRGLVYDPANFTITASGPDLSPEDLFESANATLNTYTALFGKTVAPIALSESCLSPDSLNLRKKLPVGALSASPVSEGYIGLPDVEVPDGKKLAAYGFRVLPTGQTMEYAYFVSADANELFYAAAWEDLNEWLISADKKMKTAGAFIIECAANVSSTLQEPGWISEKYSTINGGEWGDVTLTSDWYWDNVAQNEKQDKFYITAEVEMTPGQVKIGGLNFNQNHKLFLHINPYSSSHLPEAHHSETTPDSCFNQETEQCSIWTGGVGLAWTQNVAEVRVFRDDDNKWALSFTGVGITQGANSTRENVYVFKAGMRVVSSKYARNGDIYCLSENSVDATNAFSTLNFGVLNGPSSSGKSKTSSSLYIRWNDNKYREEE